MLTRHARVQNYFSTIDWALKKSTGVAVIQGITIPEARYEEYVKTEDFIRKWVCSVSMLLTMVLGLIFD